MAKWSRSATTIILFVLTSSPSWALIKVLSAPLRPINLGAENSLSCSVNWAMFDRTCTLTCTGHAARCDRARCKKRCHSAYGGEGLNLHCATNREWPSSFVYKHKPAPLHCPLWRFCSEPISFGAGSREIRTSTTCKCVEVGAGFLFKSFKCFWTRLKRALVVPCL